LSRHGFGADRWVNLGMAAVDVAVAASLLRSKGGAWPLLPVVLIEIGQAAGSVCGEPGRVVGGWLGGYAIPVATALVLLGLNLPGRPPAPFLRTPGLLLVLYGWLLSLGGLLSLGRGFSVLPQVRVHVRRTGFYRFLRHPIYTGYAVSAVGGLCLSWSPLRLLVVLAFLAGTAVRAAIEDAALGRPPRPTGVGALLWRAFRLAEEGSGQRPPADAAPDRNATADAKP